MLTPGRRETRQSALKARPAAPSSPYDAFRSALGATVPGVRGRQLWQHLWWRRRPTWCRALSRHARSCRATLALPRLPLPPWPRLTAVPTATGGDQDGVAAEPAEGHRSG